MVKRIKKEVVTIASNHHNDIDNNNDDNDNDDDDNDDDNDNDDDDDEDNENDDDDDDNDDDDDDNNDNDNKKGQDGLADMMSKILNQNVGKKIPVLAKRKLQLNKDDDDKNDKETKNKLTMLKLAKRIERERQLVIPDESNIHYERQLRKLATRGVVALFNAIAKAKKPLDQDNDNDDNIKTSSSSNHKKSSIDDVRNMTQENFLKMLKSNNLKSNNIDNNDNNNDNDNTKKTKPEKWSVLSDNYLTNRNVNLKNWDKDDDDSDDNEGNRNNKKRFKK